MVNRCSQAPAEEIKAAGSIQNVLGFRLPSAGSSGLRPDEASVQTVGLSIQTPGGKQHTWDELGSLQGFPRLQLTEGTLGARLSVPKLPWDVDRDAVHSYGCLWASWLNITVREDGATEDEAILPTRLHLNGSILGIRYPEGGQGLGTLSSPSSPPLQGKAKRGWVPPFLWLSEGIWEGHCPAF